ncbi:MAG TPA: class II aldolase/adducin family protein [Pseudonocardiaceae bacterium]|jgi:L-fuculose-phosphate aldolase|nr:class II aldolase/adducin family protein [Pseudonocardiaceae bacterium]
MLIAERARICEYGRRMVTDRLVVGTSGNISIRAGELIAVTPTGIDYGELTPESISVLDLAGRHLDGAAPTSEVPLHLAVYRGRWDVRAVVHTHSVHATAASMLVDALPPVHYLLALFGGAVRTAPYARFGTAELASAALAAMGDGFGCLLANHGAVAVGGNLAAAYDRAVQLEWLCQVWLTARGVGRPRTLPAGELAAVADAIRGYGAAGREQLDP